MPFLSKSGSHGLAKARISYFGKILIGNYSKRGVLGALAAFFIAVLLLSLNTPRAEPGSSAPFRTEIIVRTVANVRNHADVVALVALAVRYHVDLVNLAAKQDEDDEVSSGVVFYASKIAPRAAGYQTFDALGDMIGEAHMHGIRVRAWVPQFHDKVAARAQPSWQMQALEGTRVAPFSGNKRGEIFVNPLSVEVQDYQRSIVAEIARNYDVDGIVLDWVRFDAYNMDVGPQTRMRFRDAFGSDPIDIEFSKDNPRRRQWNDWRSAQIGAYIQSVQEALHDIKPGLEFGVYILPPEFGEVGQDAALFSKSVNFLSPLAYFKDWNFPANWVWRKLLPETRAKAGRAAMVPVIDEDWTDEAYREVMPRLKQDFPEISTLSWFVYGSWTEATFQRIARLRAR
jgi:hypothetical protein